MKVANNITGGGIYMDESRPDPDILLKQIKVEQSVNTRGKLKIFFGFAAGVGKTFAMLEAAHIAKTSGVDVVAGYIEPHTRPQTLALLDGLEVLPVQHVKYKDITLKEFDIDGAIKRNPQLILVDELAHTNAEGCRHAKRYQDIEELLTLGIDVYTTVNVQHIESLNDIVASITGVIVRERIPDSILDSADQVELVDIEPDDLIARLEHGKIYKEGQAKKALDNFFTRENLCSLREIALRRTADRVNKAAEKNKTASQKGDYYVGEHILICLSSSPSNAKVIRTAARMANAFHGKFTALFVETPNSRELSDQNRVNLRKNLKLAEQLGARIATVYGEDVSYQIAEYVKVSGISKIIIGRSNNKKTLFFKKQNFIDKLTALAPNVDIYVIPDNRKPYSNKAKFKLKSPVFSVADTIKAMAVLAMVTIIGFWFDSLGFSEANIITVYILGVLITAFITDGQIYGFISSIICVLTFNFFFTDPYFTFAAINPGYPATFAIMFISSFLTSTLTKRVKRQAYEASIKAYRTEVLLETSQKLQRAKSEQEIIDETASQMIKLLESDVIFYPVKQNHVRNNSHHNNSQPYCETLGDPQLFSYDKTNDSSTEYLSADEQAVAHWVYKNNKHAGATTDTLPGVKCLYLAVRSNDTVFAVVGVAIKNGIDFEAFQKNLFLAMLSECALALEKEHIMATKNQISIEAKQEQLRANLLRAISHDLRTPLTSISGNAGILMSHGDQLDIEKKKCLYTDIYDDSMWLINLVENLLSVTRIENGTMNIKVQPELLSEVIDEALSHINRKKCEHTIDVMLKDDMLMADMDVRLIVQVIINIVDNAIKYTKSGSHINISAQSKGSSVEVKISDNGDGISDESKDKLFEMFFTADTKIGDSRRGLGLGLSLCKSIIEAHGGTVSVEDNQPMGTTFIFTLQQSIIHDTL